MGFFHADHYDISEMLLKFMNLVHDLPSLFDEVHIAMIAVWVHAVNHVKIYEQKTV